MTQEKCLVCLKPLSPYPVGEKAGYAFVACKLCGSVMTSPAVTHRDRVEFFTEAQPKISHVRNHLRTIVVAEKTLQKIRQNLKGKRLLDVSCRHGYTVKAARNLGMQARGIDIHSFYIDFAQKHYGKDSFELTSVHDCAEKGEQADLVFCLEGICEQTDLEEYVAGLAKLIAPGGKLYIEEPDGNSFWLPSNFARWNYAAPPVNCVYPSLEGMRQLLLRHGLKIERKFFTIGPFMRLVVVK